MSGKGQDPILDARKLKAHTTRDKMKSVINKNLQTTFYGAQTPSALAGTVSTVDITTASAVLAPRLSAKTQCTGTTAPIHSDFYLPDKLDSRLSQMKWQTSSKLSADGNLVAVVTKFAHTLFNGDLRSG